MKRDDDDNASKASSFDSLASTPEDHDYEEESFASGSDKQKQVNDGGISHEKKHVQKLAQSESQYVRIWRRNVVMVLVIVCALVTSLTFVFLSREDHDDFETSFQLFAQTISENVEFNIKSLIEATDGVSELLTSEAIENNMTWPFVTLSSFDVYVQHTNARTSTELVTVLPIINASLIKEWNAYSSKNQNWINKGLEYSQSVERRETGISKADQDPIKSKDITPFIYHFDENFQLVIDDGADGKPVMPLWQMSPAPTDTLYINYNTFSADEYEYIFAGITSTRKLSLSGVTANYLADATLTAKQHAEMHQVPGYESMSDEELNNITSTIPHTVFSMPVFEKLNELDSNIVAVVSVMMSWDTFLRDILPPGLERLDVCLQNSCGQSYGFAIDGENVVFTGEGMHHDPKFIDYKFEIPVYKFFGQVKDEIADGDCMYWYNVYPSHDFYNQHQSKTPVTFACIVALSFLLMACTFFIYDWFVIRKNDKIVDAAAKSSAIVASMFPSNVRDRLFVNNESGHTSKSTSYKEETGKTRLSSFLNSSSHPRQDNSEVDGLDNDFLSSKPIADLFPETTVMFADLVGFTAWSSMREPSQVFILLETIYSAFDKIAKRRRVFKVETVGDCYVAVTGLPDPRRDHAAAMARFANECLIRLHELTRQLETVLGPDTGDLSMRVGMHSGPVTAGVLRGERSRFQLFGDTMNTASRMESTGQAGRIQVSQETADHILAFGKKSWLEKRSDVVVAKGKGQVNTYWLKINNHVGSEDVASSSGTSNEERVTISISNDLTNGPHLSGGQLNEKTNRLIQWNVDVLSRLLKQLIARRKCSNDLQQAPSLKFENSLKMMHDKQTPLEEVVDIITLPKFNSHAAKKQLQPEAIQLGSNVENELRDYVTSVALMYRDNPFHNFEHASHVTMSVVKLLSRIVAPIDFEPKENMANENAMRAKYESTLHDHTYGITSDPLTQFSCVLSALVHDADHSGVPNAQLIKESQSICRLYKNRSVAEQNSVDLAWELLMDTSYSNLRATVYTNESEMRRFRQLLVNSVMATDIMDKELGAQRKARWNVAFAQGDCGNKKLSEQENVNRKATIVIEHLIQASDVAHTMQHWHVYRKWNERLYRELYKAYVEGRAEKDPATFWYQGEIGFFDFYIIPLAKKLKDCGVFGVSSDEYLQYAEKNRKEWEAKGEQVVAEMAEKVRGEFENSSRIK